MQCSFVQTLDCSESDWFANLMDLSHVGQGVLGNGADDEARGAQWSGFGGFWGSIWEASWRRLPRQIAQSGLGAVGGASETRTKIGPPHYHLARMPDICFQLSAYQLVIVHIYDIRLSGYQVIRLSG